jgi:hypothetical protein
MLYCSVLLLVLEITYHSLHMAVGGASSTPWSRSPEMYSVCSAAWGMSGVLWQHHSGRAEQSRTAL